MRGSLKLTLGIGLLSLVALGIPACGDDDEGGGGSSGGGGTGAKDGGTGGSTGGAAGSGGVSGGGGSGGTGGSGPVVCGGETCKTYKVGGLFDVGACCSKNDKCGADVSATVGGLVGLPAGCYESGQKGNDDTTCPPLKFTNPLDGGPGSFDGCCNHATSKCGYTINLTSVGGPDMGCLDSAGLTDAPTSCTPKTTGDAATD